ncbi:AAA family ATPase [Algoriphagus namhaensis]|uniref:AAA family ATPase n=1 Tax=Algoriphagus namhaensis TaxID=915353 RepID=A0ABV8AQX9_9BACT
MIPKKLEIQGLYSYQEKQVVDFEQLTAAGLFGIFGAVGSGKSSILEAILLALYGSTERLSVSGERSSMMNLQSNLLLVNFEFKAGKSNNQTFLARYSAKRNKKNWEKIETGEHTLYEKVDGEWQALERNAEQIIGMKKEHFKQTVIIPQGKFREFIDLKPRDQADMMKELFGLQRFDLSQQTGTLIGAVKEEVIRLSTKLETLESVSKSALGEKRERKSQAQQTLKQQNEAFEAKQERLRTQEKIREKRLEWDRVKEELNNLMLRQAEMDAKKSHHSRYLTAKNKLKPTWDRLKALAIEIEKNQVSVKKCKDWVEDYKSEIEILEKEVDQLKKRNLERPIRESKIRDLKQVLDIKSLEQKLTQSRLKVDEIAPSIEQQKKSQKKLQSKIKELEQTQTASNLPNASTLANWKSWIREASQNQDQLEKLSQENQSLEATRKQLADEITELSNCLPDGIQNLTAWEKQEQNLLESREKQYQVLKDQLGIAAYVQHLHDGSPCPLCGSEEHPHPASEKDGFAALSEIENQIQESKNLIAQIRADQKTNDQVNFQLEQITKEKQNKTNSLQETKKEQVRISNEITRAGFENLEQLKHEIEIKENEVNTQEKRAQAILELRSQLEDSQASVEKLEIAFQSTRKEFDQIQSAIETKRNEIWDIEFTKDFFSQELSSIHETIEAVQKSILSTEQKLDGAVKHLHDRKLMQSQNATSLKMYEEALQRDQEERNNLLVKFESEKASHGFTDDGELKVLFEESLDEEKVAQEIRRYEDRLNVLKNKVDELSQDQALGDFQEDKFNELKTEILAEAEQLEASKSELTLLIQEIKTLEVDLQQKTELLQQLEKATHRQSNLKELDVLFRGGGFVKFVSSIYLRELCNTANIRFMKLTKNQLSLDIDDNNTFWVVDYLNGGKRRLLKTLSGGQTFQASLCLALALAEKIKALNQADQSFFFMDEGFGALDKSSLGVVFDTLKSLQFENRIVGIISHVEDLQQEIGVYAKVELDPENGSQISYSFA